MFYFGSDYGVRSGMQTIGGRTYLLYEGGDFATGWRTIEGKDYYFTQNGSAAFGFTDIDGSTYILLMKTPLHKGLSTSAAVFIISQVISANRSICSLVTLL